MNNVTVKNQKDIYFDDNYGKLYENIENGKAEVFHFKNDIGEVKHQFILREIPTKIGGDTYYDITTPYGYGGPIILDCNENQRAKLVSQFYNQFSVFCKENKIVSEFVRFHPIEGNSRDFFPMYDVSCIRKTLGTNLKDYKDPIQSEFSKSCRKNIRKALNKGITYEIIENPRDIDEFKKIYYSTMDRNNASDYYYFDESYFEEVISLFKKNTIIVKAIYEGKTIAQGLYFIYGKNIHIHLSGTLSEYLYLSPAYILRYAVTIWGKENGYYMIHHGGGRSNSKEDGLYKFKKGFAKNTEFDFYVGKKIWNNLIYEALCTKVDVDEAIEFFPIYRYEKSD